MTTGRALFAGPAAVRALVDGRLGVVELALAQGAYLRLGSDYVFLGEPSLPFGPLSIAVTGVRWHDMRPGVDVRVAGKRVVLGNDVVSYERMRSRRPPDVASSGAAQALAIRFAARAALAELPPAPLRLRDGIAALVAARVDEAVGLLAGVGDGLTPTGDDVLAGYAAARFSFDGLAAGLSRLAAGRSSGVALAYLRSAERGELPDPAARLLGAIRQGSPAVAGRVVAGLSRWGSSSGVALGWGVTAAICGPDP